MDYLYVAIGLVGLYFGGEWLVRHASALARTLGVAPMIVGLTVVAFGTSSPELAASIVAAVRGAPEVAIGNVVGSNVANIGVILAIAALVFPMKVSLSFIRREVGWMLVATALGTALLFDGRVTRFEGALLVTFLVAFLLWSIRVGATRVGAPDSGHAKAPLLPTLAWIAASLLVLGFGAQFLVDGATSLATAWGVPERVIGLTLVAIGTSLPELASSVVAALRRETDIVLGNVIGSNLFNLAGVLGPAALVHPMTADPAGLRIDLLVMGLFALVIVPLFARGWRLGRRDGILLLVLYGGYLAWLFV